MTAKTHAWIAIISASVMLMPNAATAGEIATAWTTTKTETKARLVAGSLNGKPAAALQIELAPGWKTYWRFPGDAGGVPPMFDWTKSDNVASADVSYPVPTRFVEKGGDTLGYKDAVAFPITIKPKDASQPVSLKLALDYGVCREVCVPVEAELAIVIAPDASNALPVDVLAAIERVPRTADKRRPSDPRLVGSVTKLDGPTPSLTIDAEFPGGTTGAAAYVESPEGNYIPLPKTDKVETLGENRLRFFIDLTGAVDPADIKGREAKVTLVSNGGLSEATFKIE
jgi:DsbC/DsbD-like thiol-disulfide interchange protein